MYVLRYGHYLASGVYNSLLPVSQIILSTTIYHQSMVSIYSLCTRNCPQFCPSHVCGVGSACWPAHHSEHHHCVPALLCKQLTPASLTPVLVDSFWFLIDTNWVTLEQKISLLKLRLRVVIKGCFMGASAGQRYQSPLFTMVGDKFPAR